jgi:anti-anti-sigma regulatory factor
MICRIDRVVDGDNLIVLRISGKLTGEHVATLQSVLRAEAGPVAIDLKEVSLVDCEAVQLLALAEYNQTELRNCPAYIREWVTREKADIDGKRHPAKRHK